VGRESRATKAAPNGPLKQLEQKAASAADARRLEQLQALSYRMRKHHALLGGQIDALDREIGALEQKLAGQPKAPAAEPAKKD
jgi:hypothetical protein